MNSTNLRGGGGGARENLVRKDVEVMRLAKNSCHELYFTYAACQALLIYVGFYLGDLNVSLILKIVSRFQERKCPVLQLFFKKTWG